MDHGQPMQVLDPDGLPVPEVWQGNPQRWAALPLSVRQSRAAPPVADNSPTPFGADRPARVPQPDRAPRPYAKRYTTDYAVGWGRKQGWTLIERERYDFRTKRHHDLMLGVDALFEGPDGMIGVQGAGKSERKAHWDRFLARGGPDKAARRHIKICYAEFERGNKTPITVEWWA